MIVSEKQFLVYVKGFEGGIKYLCMNYFVPQLDKDDVKQEILMKLWIAKDGYDPERAEFNTWAQTISRNHIKNLMRFHYTQKRKAINFYLSLEMVDEVAGGTFSGDDGEEQNEFEF